MNHEQGHQSETYKNFVFILFYFCPMFVISVTPPFQNIKIFLLNLQQSPPTYYKQFKRFCVQVYDLFNYPISIIF